MEMAEIMLIYVENLCYILLKTYKQDENTTVEIENVCTCILFKTSKKGGNNAVRYCFKQQKLVKMMLVEIENVC